MDNPINAYWQIKLEALKARLEKNNFEVHIAQTAEDAHTILLQTILPQTGARSLSWGGSLTFIQTQLYDALKEASPYEILDTYDNALLPDQKQDIRRQALLADLYITGTNAVTQSGQLVNLDMIGNRVAAITFGPKHVVILVGRNKIVASLEDAKERIKNYAAPVNVMRLDKKTPCVQTAECQDCKSPDRICNTWTITEKSFPKGRVKVILINADLGF